MRYPLPWFRPLVCPNRNNPRTKPGCRRSRNIQFLAVEGDGGKALHRRRERRFSRGRLKNRNRVHTAYTLRKN